MSTVPERSDRHLLRGRSIEAIAAASIYGACRCNGHSQLLNAVAAAESSDNRTIDDVYSDLGDWATAREERIRYERARQQRASTDRQEI